MLLNCRSTDLHRRKIISTLHPFGRRKKSVTLLRWHHIERRPNMTDLDLFHCRRLPARLTIEQVALLLGFQVYEILILVRLGRIKSVNYQSRNSRKYFHGQYILKLASQTYQTEEFIFFIVFRKQDCRSRSTNKIGRLTAKSSQQFRKSLELFTGDGDQRKGDILSFCSERTGGA
jgi:hypothetical protein